MKQPKTKVLIQTTEGMTANNKTATQAITEHFYRVFTSYDSETLPDPKPRTMKTLYPIRSPTCTEDTEKQQERWSRQK